MAAPKKPKKKGKNKKLSPAERQAGQIKRAHARLIRNVFLQSGFKTLTPIVGKHFKYKTAKSEFDDVFVLDNIVVVAEYTAHSESNVPEHLKNKKILYDEILKDPAAFVEFLKQDFPDTNPEFSSLYNDSQYRVRIVYCSRYALKGETKAQVPGPLYLDYNYARYFSGVVGTIKRSARYELLDFLKVQPAEFSERILNPQLGQGATYAGSILPENHSHFPKGYKVVSFYVDAGALLERAYVLRRDGWRGGANLYQRMIVRTKIDTIRKHLADGNAVFMNNIIATLPPDTKLLDDQNNTIDVSKITSTAPGRVQLSSGFSSIGLIDGQHRVFSYHEGGSHEEKMKILRKQQNLLLTGIIFPANISDEEKLRFQAKIFSEINSNQTTAKSDLIQEIGMMLRPYSADSIARRVMNHLNDDQGPLRDQFERYFFDQAKLKTTSVVSYGLRLLVKIDGDESLYSLWSNPNKSELLNSDNDALLAEYISYCVSEINLFLAGARANVSGRWSPKIAGNNGILTTTFLNGLIYCLRRIVKKGALCTFEEYKAAFKGLPNFPVESFKSSQYNKMGTKLFEAFFE